MKLSKITAISNLSLKFTQAISFYQGKAAENQNTCLSIEEQREFGAVIDDFITKLQKQRHEDIPKEVRLMELFREVRRITGLTEDELKERTRKREIVEARQIIMAVYHSLLPNVTETEAARVFKMNHASTIHSRKTVRNLLETSKTYAENWAPIIKWAEKINSKFEIKQSVKRY